jgi:hypothetical protein
VPPMIGIGSEGAFKLWDGWTIVGSRSQRASLCCPA